MKMPPVTENKNSRLLTTEEHMQVFKLLGNRCQSICTTVAQLYCTEHPHHSQWLKKDVGVLCLVKDNTRKNYFFRLFCLRRNSMVWEQEVYNNMDYNESTIFLHIFEGEDTVIAFNFPNSDEAKEFKMSVDEKLVRGRRKDERHRVKQTPANQFSYNSQTLKDPHDYKRIQDPAIKQAKRKRNITKADIGVPLNFQHISHVGWNPDSGFDVDVQDENLMCFFQKAGISEKQLQDRDTKEFIYDFINRNGGREAVEKSANRNSRRAPAVPPQPLVVPPVPPRGPSRPHVRVAPPPPPPVQYNFDEKPIPPPPPIDFGGPVPPPPPPPVPKFVGNLNESEDSTSVSSAGGSSGMGTALLESIRTGTTLRPVEARNMAVSGVVEAKNSTVGDSRGDLLKQIRAGTQLKPICERDFKQLAPVETPRPGGDLAEALARALAERSKAIHSDDDDDDEDDFNDDEWAD